MNRIPIGPFLLLFMVLSCWEESPKEELLRIELDNGKVVALFDNKEWDYVEDTPRDLAFFASPSKHEVEADSPLRSGISTSKEVMHVALEMKNQGWVYYMPRPKSKGATWRNRDGRTTWHYGYWHNTMVNKYSSELPLLSNDGMYEGNLVDLRNEWRTGGRPRNPTELEWLLSLEGGIKPE